MWKRVRTQPQHLPLRHTLIRTPAPTHVVVTRTLQRLFIDTHVYLVRYLESDSSVFSFLFVFSLNPYERNTRRTSTPQETRQGEEKEREREMDEKERSKERERARAIYPIIFIYLFIFISTHTASTDSFASTASRFTTTTATTPMRPSTSHRTECVDNYPHSITSLFLAHASFSFHRDTNTFIHLFLTTLPLLFSFSIVRRYVLIVCTDERESRVDQLYSQRRGAETEMCRSARTQTHIALLPALTTH